MCCVYRVFWKKDKSKTIYVGSSCDFVRRWFKNHLDPKYSGHGPFGKWIHSEKKADEIDVEILEEISDWSDTHEKLQHEIKRREFLWKSQFPAEFGKMDGLYMQPKEVQREHKRKMKKAWRHKNYADPIKHEYQKKRMRYNKMWQRKRKRWHKKILKELHAFFKIRKRMRKHPNRGLIYCYASMSG